MKKIECLLILLAAAVTLQAQRTIINDPNVETRKVSSFHAIEVSGGIDLYLSQADEEALAVGGSSSSVTEDIAAIVDDGVLKIWFRNNGRTWTSGNRKMRAYVAFKKLDKLKASGASEVIITGELRAEEISIELSGASDLKGVVHADKVNIDQSGASDADLSGKAAELTITASGASDVNAYALESETCSVRASGASDVKVNVSKTLDADYSGASSVKNRGKAPINNKRTEHRRS